MGEMQGIWQSETAQFRVQSLGQSVVRKGNGPHVAVSAGPSAGREGLDFTQ